MNSAVVYQCEYCDRMFYTALVDHDDTTRSFVLVGKNNDDDKPPAKFNDAWIEAFDKFTNGKRFTYAISPEAKNKKQKASAWLRVLNSGPLDPTGNNQATLAQKEKLYKIFKKLSLDYLDFKPDTEGDLVLFMKKFTPGSTT